MVAPERVRTQAAAAEAAIALAAKGNTEQPAPAVQPAPQPAAPAPAPAPAVAPDPVAELDIAKKALVASEQRFSVLQGKYNAEVPRLSEQVRVLTEQVTDLNTKLTTATAKPLVSDADRERFGADMVDMAHRVATEAVRTAVAPLEETIGTVKSSVDNTAKVTARTAKDKFWDDVDALLAAKNLVFDTVNESPGFIAWLGDKDSFSGETRMDLLEKAQQSFDAARTALFFTTYADGLPKGDAAASLAEQLQPDLGTGGGDLTVLEPGRIWTGAQIQKFYREKREGKYKGKEKEAAGIEADILAAQREGRYRP